MHSKSDISTLSSLIRNNLKERPLEYLKQAVKGRNAEQCLHPCKSFPFANPPFSPPTIFVSSRSAPFSLLKTLAFLHGVHSPRTQSVSHKVTRCLCKFQCAKVPLTPIKHPGHHDRLGAYNDHLGDSEYHRKVLFAVLIFVVLVVPAHTILEPLSPP